MSVWITFAKGLLTGIPFGVLFNTPKWGKIIVLGLGCTVGIWLLLDSSILIELSSCPWYINAANLLGVIIGQFMGGILLNEILDERRQGE